MLSLNFTFRLRYLLRNLHPLDERHFHLLDKGLVFTFGRRQVQLFRKFPQGFAGVRVEGADDGLQVASIDADEAAGSGDYHKITLRLMDRDGEKVRVKERMRQFHGMAMQRKAK